MNAKLQPKNPRIILLLSRIFYFIISAVFFNQTFAQNNRAVMGEMATCKVTVNYASVNNNSNSLLNAGNAESAAAATAAKKPSKTYQLKPNQLGFFDQVPNLQPLQWVPVEVLYPQGKAGEKVLISAEDGGRFDNGKMISVAQLDAQKKVSFNFHLSDQSGIFHVSLRKGNDIKVVQLWVGPDPFSAKKD